jgi:hypothetical protein
VPIPTSARRAARVYHPRVALHASRCARCAALCPPSCATLRSDKKPSDPRAVWKRVGKKLLAKRNCCCFVVVCRRRESCSSKMWWRASLRREWAHSFTRTKCRCVCGCFLCALRLSYGGVAHNGCHPTGVVDHAPITAVIQPVLLTMHPARAVVLVMWTVTVVIWTITAVINRCFRPQSAPHQLRRSAPTLFLNVFKRAPA